MSRSSILVVWSDYYGDLAEKQLESCLKQIKDYPYEYQLEKVTSGTYEIPAVIQYYQQNNPFGGYIPLSLLLKGKTDHYEFIWEHVKDCFIQMTMNGIILASSGIISAPSMDILCERVENGERVQEALRAVDYLMRLKNKYSR